MCQLLILFNKKYQLEIEKVDNWNYCEFYIEMYMKLFVPVPNN